MTRALVFAVPMSLLIWGLIGFLAWYAPGVLFAIGGGCLAAFVYEVVMED